MCWKEKEKYNTLGKKETASLCRSHKNVFIMMMLKVFVICRTGTCSVLQLDPLTRGLCCNAGFCSGQMSDVYTCLAGRFDPFLSSLCVNIMTHFFSSPSANSAVWWCRVGPLLISHGAASCSRAPVQPAGRRGDKVSDTAGGPVYGRGKSGPNFASGEAGVCMQSSAKAVGFTFSYCCVSTNSSLRFNQIKRFTWFRS